MAVPRRPKAAEVQTKQGHSIHYFDWEHHIRGASSVLAVVGSVLDSQLTVEAWHLQKSMMILSIHVSSGGAFQERRALEYPEDSSEVN